MVDPRSKAVLLVRSAAVVVTLGGAAFLVYRAQVGVPPRSAPTPPSATTSAKTPAATVDATPAEVPAATPGADASSAEALAITTTVDAPLGEAAADPAFLHSSKTLMLTPDPSFLLGSKSGPIDVDLTDAPMEVPAPAPVFLPSTKVRSVDPQYLPTSKSGRPIPTSSPAETKKPDGR